MILFLKPYFEEKPWAGTKIKEIYNCSDNVGEAWIISGYKGKSSIVKNGPYKGMSLDKLWNTQPQLFGNFKEKEFPLLVKLIDAKENLSVQVHPDDSYALKKHNQLGKFECWYILPETKAKDIICDLTINNIEDIRYLINNGMLEDYLFNREIKPHDLVVIDPGTVHAIKADTFLLEVQESSDITYRLYDYNREPKRELHIEDSLNVIKNNSNRNPIYEFNTEDTFKNKYFDFHKLHINGKTKLDNKGFELFYIIEGEGSINETPIKKGDTFILTVEESESFILDGKMELLAMIPKQKNQERLDKMRKTAFITGIIGQDGLSLTKFLITKDYEIHGLVQSKSQLNNSDVKKFSEYIGKTLFFHVGDMTDSSSLNRLIDRIKPDEIYHLAGQNHVDSSFEIPEYTAEVNSLGTLRLLEAIKDSYSKTKLFNLSTCHLYSGNIYPQNEDTIFEPRTPFATSKLFSYYIVKNYRECYNLFITNGVCYNRDSIDFYNSLVFKKIIENAKNVKNQKYEVLHMGNLDSVREWGNVDDYALAMWMSLQADKPGDYNIGTGEAKSIREWIKLIYSLIGINLVFKGEGVNEKAYDESGRLLIEVSPTFFRPNDAKYLVSDATKFKNTIGWEPKTKTIDMIKAMLELD